MFPLFVFLIVAYSVSVIRLYDSGLFPSFVIRIAYCVSIVCLFDSGL